MVVFPLVGGGSSALDMGDSLSEDGPPLVDVLLESVVDIGSQPTATGARVPPRPSFAGKRSFSCVASLLPNPPRVFVLFPVPNPPSWWFVGRMLWTTLGSTNAVH